VNFEWAVAASITGGVLLLIGVVRAFLVRRLVKARQTASKVDDFVLDVTERTKLLLLLLPAIFLGARALELPIELRRWIRLGAILSLVAQTALWTTGVIDFWLRRYRRARIEDPSAVMTVNAFRVAALVAVWLVAATVAGEHLGFKVTAIIAGLGIGGVAIALALQNILGDLFASLSIVIDKPFVLGDPISVDDHAGTVEHIGLKTTRLRSVGGEQLIFSNGDLLKSRIRNFKRMTERRSLTLFRVPYDTPVEKLERIPLLLKSAVEKQPETRFDRAHLVRLGEMAYELELAYFVEQPEYVRFLDVQQAVYLDVIRAFAAEGIVIARK
jgi:small-conductance mechanosensitive channel